MEIATLFPGFYTKCLQPGSQRYLHSLSIAALFTIEKIWKQSEWLLIHGWIKNMSGILSFAVKISQKNEVILKAGKGSKKVEYVGLWGSKLGDRLACRRFTRSYFQNQRLWEGMQNWTEGEVGWDEVHQKCQSNPGRALKLRRAFRDAKSRGSGLFIPSLVSHWMKTALGRRDTLGQGGLALLRQFLEGNENWPLLVRIIPNGWENKSLIPQEGSEWHILEFTSKGLLKYGTPRYLSLISSLPLPNCPLQFWKSQILPHDWTPVGPYLMPCLKSLPLKDIDMTLAFTWRFEDYCFDPEELLKDFLFPPFKSLT